MKRALVVRTAPALAMAASLLWIAAGGMSAPSGNAPLPFSEDFAYAGTWTRQWQLREGQAFEIRVGLNEPSLLRHNARLEVRWKGPALPELAFDGERGDLSARASADWAKVLHALDPDVYLVYRAPKAGLYTLEIAAVTDREPPAPDYHRDTGLAPLATKLPAKTPQPPGAALSVDLRPLDRLHQGDILLEAEPNSTPEQAQLVPFEEGDANQVIRIIGSADELDYFNNLGGGASPDDWYKIVYRGSKAKIFTANLQLAEPAVSARIRVYKPGIPTAEEMEPREPPPSEDFGNANPVPYVHPPAGIIPGPEQVYTYYEGRDINERLHQQDDNYRTFVTRRVEPGGTYYLRVEANQPGYELEVRLLDPAPFQTPQEAVSQAIYYHLAEVDAWLIHRPRNIALHQRVRDGSSMFGENCMSCHTQSGVWGVADAFRHGYRPDGTAQNWRRLVNTMYESLRPTVKLEDAASNTSLAPNDLGDAPAGSRVAGRNIVLHERTFRPKKLHAYQQRRTANYVLQTADPAGINAAGKGSNFGPVVVFKFAAEILDRAWRDTGDPKYFWGLEEKARKALDTTDIQLKVVDDLGHRIEFFHDLLPEPEEYLATVARLTDNDAQRIAEAREFYGRFAAQVKKDLARLLALQQENGGWGFDLGVPQDSGWQRMDEEPDAAPTAVALMALRAAGYGPQDEPVKRAVQWLLANQYEYGLWNRAAQTGFVTTAYTIRALSRLYPGDAKPFERAAFEPRPNESSLETLSRVRALQATGQPEFADLMIEATRSEHPRVRYYGYLGLGGALAAEGTAALIQGLEDPVKTCREAAFWSLRQLLLDDTSWEAAFEAYRTGADRTRQSAIQALVSRADLEGSGASVDPKRLAALLGDAMNDPHPGVRSYALKAAWRWWVWNPAMRDAINRAWVEALAREEPNALAETALRYSTASMLMVNGQIANQTGGKNADQQYRELSELYKLLDERRRRAAGDEALRLDRRLAAVAATHFQERGNDGGPGQMGYSTPGSSEVMGEAVLALYRRGDPGDRVPWRKIALEGAANIQHERLQHTLLTLLQTGDLDMVAAASRALSNPQALTLPAAPEALRPMLEKVAEFLRLGRKDDAEALANFLSKVTWDFDGLTEEQERAFYRLLLPADQQIRRSASDSAAQGLFGRPAPQPSPPAAEPDTNALLLGRILGGNRSLQRETVFDLVGEGSSEFWLPSTEWMIAFEQGGLTAEEAIEGAVEAENLEIVELTFGRTTEQIVPNGLASKNSVLFWREGVPGAKLALAVEAPEAGRYELISAFLYDREMGTVQFALNGEDIGDPRDFYRPDLSATGPVSLGVHEFNEGRNLFTVKMAGSNAEAEPNYIFGIDYIKLEPDKERGSLFTKDDLGVDVIDPIVAAKDEVIRMFAGWFAPETPRELRAEAIRMANSTALRRNSEVRKALAAYVDNEPDSILQTRIQNILNSDDSVYGEQLRKLITEQKDTLTAGEIRPVDTSEKWIKDILWFRDYLFAELNKIQQSDNRACISCHGVPGRVPTLYLHPPDAAGYIAPEQLLENYRRMQQRVDLSDVERSKFLLKPLNIQTGEDDGHQGGARYEPEDAGYQVIAEWVRRQAELQREP